MQTGVILRGGGLLSLIRAPELRPAHDEATSHYRPDIDGLRGIAVMAVLLFHGGFSAFSGGFVGVDIFFVISGFLIGRIVLTQIASGSFSLLSFYDRRVRRILPPLVTVVAATLVIGFALLLPSQFKNLGFEVVATMTFVSNVWFWRRTGYFHPASETLPLLHTWSLSIEEQYYLLFPALIIACYAISRRIVLPAMAVVLVLSFALGVIFVVYVPSAAFFLLPTRAWELLVGVMLATSPVAIPRSSAIATAAGALGLILMLGAIHWLGENMLFPGAIAAIPVAGAALVIWAGATSNPVSRALSGRGIVFVGLISYSLYLWHWPIYVAAHHLFAAYRLTPAIVIPCIFLSALLAIGSVRFVEAPFRDREAMPARRAYTILGAALALICAAATAAIWSDGAPYRFGKPTLELAAGSEDFSELGERCRNLALAQGWRKCRLGNAIASPTFLLWGDSHAAALAPAITDAASRTGRTGLLIASDGCFPLVNSEGLGMARPDRDRCHRRLGEVMVLIAAHPELEILIITARWNRGGAPGYELAAALRQTTIALASMHRKLVVIADLPVPEGDVPWRLALDREAGRARAPFVHRQASGPFYRQVLMLSGDGKIRYISLAPALCGSEGCRASLEGRSLYTDDNHISAFGATRLLAPYLDRVGLFDDHR